MGEETLRACTYACLSCPHSNAGNAASAQSAARPCVGPRSLPARLILRRARREGAPAGWRPRRRAARPARTRTRHVAAPPRPRLAPPRAARLQAHQCGRRCKTGNAFWGDGAGAPGWCSGTVERASQPYQVHMPCHSLTSSCMSRAGAPAAPSPIRLSKKSSPAGAACDTGGPPFAAAAAPAAGRPLPCGACARARLAPGRGGCSPARRRTEARARLRRARVRAQAGPTAQRSSHAGRGTGAATRCMTFRTQRSRASARGGRGAPRPCWRGRRRAAERTGAAQWARRCCRPPRRTARTAARSAACPAARGRSCARGAR
jgi:hypothetical protein